MLWLPCLPAQKTPFKRGLVWGLKAALASHGGKNSLQHAQQHLPAILSVPLHARRPDVRGQQLTWWT